MGWGGGVSQPDASLCVVRRRDRHGGRGTRPLRRSAAFPARGHHGFGAAEAGLRAAMRIAVCRPQVPFARGGAEIFADDLVSALRARGHEADLVTVPFKWYPGQRVLSQAFLWRLLDLDEAEGQRIDLVIATKFPSYCIRHPNKIAWVLHQFRQAYEL